MSTLMTRRDFGARMVVLGAGSVLFTAAPFCSTTALAEVSLTWGKVPPIDMGFDGALENQPGYSAVIPYRSEHLVVAVEQGIMDGQFLV